MRLVHRLKNSTRRIAAIRVLWAPALAAAVSLQTAGITLANDVLINGAPGAGDSSPQFILVNPGAADTVQINVNTIDITGPAGDTIRVNGQTGSTGLNIAAGRSVSGATSTGVYIRSTTGNINAVIDGDVSSAFNGTTLDARFAPPGGDIRLSGGGTLFARGGTGAWLLADTGSVTMDGFSSIEAGGKGVHVEATAGISLGASTALGSIIAGGNGIEVAQLFSATGNGPIFVGVTNVTSGATGIRTIGWQPDTSISVAGTIDAGSSGIFATTSSGNSHIDIASSAIVQGGSFGIITGTATGLATVSNNGLIRNTADTGAATDPGATAFWAIAGNTQIENAGSIVGRINTDGSDAFILNNLAAGTWTPATGTNSFGGLDDAVNNYGRINVRSGSTEFEQLEVFNNLLGGHIDMSYGAGAADTLFVQNLSTADGSVFTFNFDATAANNSGSGFDASADGLGTADTIVVSGTSTPSGVSQVNIVPVNGQPTAETGSVSLIYTGTNITAPPAGAPTTPSQFFSFGAGDPSDSSVAYSLVDDGNGGLYLQWAPTLMLVPTNNRMAGFTGGYLSDNTFAPSAMNTTVGKLGTVVGGIGGLGGPAGGGVAARIGDDAAYSLMNGGSSRCIHGQLYNTWFLVGAAGTGYSPGGQGSTVGFAGGIERDLWDVADVTCGRSAIGAFFFENQANDRWLNGSTYSDTSGLGTYLRAAGDSGLYGSLIGTLSWSDSDLVNRMTGSSANQDNSGYTLAAIGGYLVPVADATFLDFRSFVSYGSVNGSAFTDSTGTTVTGSDAGITTLGLMAGINHNLTRRQAVFARGGVKWFDLNQHIATGPMLYRGSVDAVVGSVEVGYREALTKNISLDAWLSGDFGRDFTSGGGRVGITIGL